MISRGAYLVARMRDPRLPNSKSRTSRNVVPRSLYRHIDSCRNLMFEIDNVVAETNNDGTRERR